MIKTLNLLSRILLLSGCIFSGALARAYAQPKLTASLIDTSGQINNAATYRCLTAVGEPVTAEFIGTTYKVKAGFVSAAVSSSPPSIDTSPSPFLGTSNPNQEVSFTAGYTDADGWGDIQSAFILINTSASGSACLYAYYNQPENKLYLRNDFDTAWLGGYAPGSSNTIENSYVKINCAGTQVLGNAQALSLNWRVIFKSSFTGVKTVYLSAQDAAALSTGWVSRGTWTITHLLSISVNPKSWNIGPVSVNTTVTMNAGSKITVLNDGSGPQTLVLSLQNPAGWTSAINPGIEVFVLSGVFCNSSDVPEPAQFNQDASSEDTVGVQSKSATASVFGYSQGTANGVAVPAGISRSLYLQLKPPVITQKKDEQAISVIISCQSP